MMQLFHRRKYRRKFLDALIDLACIGTVLILSIASTLPIYPTIAAAVPNPSPSTPRASPMTPATVLERLFQTQPIASDWFTAKFLAAVPIAQVEQIIAQVKGQLGDLQSVQGTGQKLTLQFAQGTMSADLVLTPEGKIAGLLLGVPVKTVKNLQEAIAQFQQLPGKVSVLVREGKTVRAELNAQEALGVGSAFKLAVLDALKTQISTQKTSWQAIVPLQAPLKSLPSGMLQTWPDGSWLTVQSLAALMISQSDNTATDHLIQLVGRENIEAIAPRNRPFLMTREFFQLKSNQNKIQLERYRQGNLTEKRSILVALAKQPLPDVSEFVGSSPNALDIEWFFTADELCQLIDRVSDLPLMSINPGVAKSEAWQQVVYKGGSEAGVLNLTTGLQNRQGQRYCVVATWNHTEAIDETQFISLYSGLLEVLK
jgi:beta-lactamase class A